MKQLLEYVIPHIVNHPEDVQISEEQVTDGIILSIKVHPEDMGRVIGKQGKVIKAIRQLVRIMAVKNGTRVSVDLVDENSSTPETTSTETQPES